MMDGAMSALCWWMVGSGFGFGKGNKTPSGIGKGQFGLMNKCVAAALLGE